MSVRIRLKFVRSDHINCPIRLPGYGKNIASSVILFPKIIFLCIEKHILESWHNLICFFFRGGERGWFWFDFLQQVAIEPVAMSMAEKKKLDSNSINM